MKLKVTAPNRIDLAGGTLDIWPLYAFLGGGYTVNAAISMCSEAQIETRTDGKFDIRADDIDEAQCADSLEALDPTGQVDLIVRVLKVYKPKVGLTIRTRCHAPKGTGLGSSSSLVIALSAGLLAIEGRSLDDGELIDIAAHIEAEDILNALSASIAPADYETPATAFLDHLAQLFGDGSDRIAFTSPPVEPLPVEQQPGASIHISAHGASLVIDDSDRWLDF